MRYCLDTRFLFAIADKSKRHGEMFQSFYRGMHYVVLPTVCMAEFVSRAHKQGKSRSEIDRVIGNFNVLNRSQLLFNIDGLSVPVAIGAGKMQHKYSLGLGDSIVAATALNKRCDRIITDDPDFDVVKGIKTMF